MIRTRSWFGGDRTVEEQLKGLDAAIAEARGKTVLDLGCAEGAIAERFVQAGALIVHGLDNNLVFLRAAQKLAGVRVDYSDLNTDWLQWLHVRYDIVLALAIVHKMTLPEARLKDFAARCGGLLVLRLPFGSDGAFQAKHSKAICDTRRIMAEAGFLLERDEEGPRGERVHYWRNA